MGQGPRETQPSPYSLPLSREQPLKDWGPVIGPQAGGNLPRPRVTEGTPRAQRRSFESPRDPRGRGTKLLAPFRIAGSPRPGPLPPPALPQIRLEGPEQLFLQAPASAAGGEPLWALALSMPQGRREGRLPFQSQQAPEYFLVGEAARRPMRCGGVQVGHSPRPPTPGPKGLMQSQPILPGGWRRLDSQPLPSRASTRRRPGPPRVAMTMG